MSEIIVPSMSASEAEDMDRLLRFAISQDEMRRFKFEHRQRQIAAAEEKLAPQRYGALGEEMLVIDPEVFAAWDVIETGCWADKGFIKQMLSRNDYCRVKAPPRRLFNGF